MNTRDWKFEVEQVGPCPTEGEALTLLAAAPRAALRDAATRVLAADLKKWSEFYACHPCAGEVEIMLFGFGIRARPPRRIIKTESGATMPIIRAEVKRPPTNPKTAGYRICIWNGYGKQFWSPGAHVRCCSQHRSDHAIPLPRNA